MLRSVSLLLLASLPAVSQDLFTAIRLNQLDAIRNAPKEAVNAPGRYGLAPLHYAAAFGSLEAIQALLEKDADVNAKDPRDSTPLHYGAWDPARAQLLLSKGALPDAPSKQKRTPLLVAASSPSGAASVPLFLKHGANPKARDVRGFNLLLPSAFADPSALLGQGFPVAEGADGAGFTPLHLAAVSNNLASARTLIAKGADVNAANTFLGRVKHGDIALKGITPLMMASAAASPEMVQLLLDAGANPNQQDVRGMTALMFALSTENPRVDTAKLLLARGTKLDLKMTSGDTAADWVHRSRYPAALALVKSAPRGAAPAVEPPLPSPAPTAQAAALRALQLLDQSTASFFAQSGCGSCHNHTATALAFQSVHAAGLPVDESRRRQLGREIAVPMAPEIPQVLQGFDFGGVSDTAMNYLVGMAAANYQADVVTDALVHYLALAQLPNGSWNQTAGIARPPAEESIGGRTAWAVRALRAYPLAGRQAEMDLRIAKARSFLLAAKPLTAYEHAEKLLGLHWAGAARAEVQAAAQGLLAQQHQNGGFSQNAHLAPDAYATGFALWALHESGTLSPKEPSYRKGAAYLVRTQRADGSWYVASRAPKFQPYFEGGFPYGHDQWISAHATAYSAMALAPVGTLPLQAENR
jgi:ankyrin repeat protein